MSAADFINKIKPKALDLRAKYGLMPSLTMGQICLESGWGAHAPGNNFLGIKVPKGQEDTWPADRKQLLKTKEWSDAKKKYIDVLAWFVKYATFDDCMERYAKILLLDRYKQTREAKDFLLATTYIKLNGYATSPKYTENLRRVILLNGLYTADYRTDPGKWVTTNFQWWEIFCNVVFEGKIYYKILEPYPEFENNAIRTLRNFQILRSFYNMKMELESGWRTEQNNASLPGSSPTSKHLPALAGDLKPARFIPRQELIKTALEKTEFKGFGIMAYNMHMDIRPKYTTWTY